MDMILRAALIYGMIWLLFRLSGRRTMSEMTTFDFALLLICGEATQQALLGDDYSITNAAGVVLTLVCLDRVLSVLRARSKRIEQVMEGIPIVIVANGKVLHDRLRRERVDEDDILHEARRTHGLSSLSEVRHAVLEPSGEISVIPMGVGEPE